MRKLILFFLILAMLCVPCAAEDIAGEGNGAACGEALSWSVEGSTLYISGQGDMYDFSGAAPWDAYRYSITNVIIGDGVTSVGAYAFHDYDALQSVGFGNSVARIGAEAFSGCDGLTSISLPAAFKKFGENSFRSCSRLTEIHCSGNFPRFDDNCLWDTHCTIYFSVNNPWSVVYIEQLENAFHGRIEFRASDGSDPYVPTEATQAPVYIPETYPTQPVYIPETYPTQPVTVPVYTEPPVTMPQTVPTAAPTLPPPTAATVPETTAAPTQETMLFASQSTRPPEPPRRGTDGNSIYGVIIIVLVLSIIATSALLFRAVNKPRRRKRRRR